MPAASSSLRAPVRGCGSEEAVTSSRARAASSSTDARSTPRSPRASSCRCSPGELRRRAWQPAHGRAVRIKRANETRAAPWPPPPSPTASKGTRTSCPPARSAGSEGQHLARRGRQRYAALLLGPGPQGGDRSVTGSCIPPRDLAVPDQQRDLHAWRRPRLHPRENRRCCEDEATILLHSSAARRAQTSEYLTRRPRPANLTA